MRVEHVSLVQKRLHPLWLLLLRWPFREQFQRQEARDARLRLVVRSLAPWPTQPLPQIDRGAVTRSQKGKKVIVVFKQGDSCSFSHDAFASGNSGEPQRRKGRSSSPAPNSKANLNRKGKFSLPSDKNDESSVDPRSKIPYRGETAPILHVAFRHHPVRQNCKQNTSPDVQHAHIFLLHVRTFTRTCVCF